jgi:hypothetical protein
LLLLKGEFHPFEGGILKGSFSNGVFQRGEFSYKGQKAYVSYLGKWFVDSKWPFNFDVNRLPHSVLKEDQPL